MSRIVVIIVLLSISLGIGLTIQSASAIPENGIIKVPFTNNPPNIDGSFTSDKEWKDASVTTIRTIYGDTHLFTMHDNNKIYFLFDTSNYPDEFGVLYIFFDTKDTGGNFLTPEDYMMTISHGSKTTITMNSGDSYDHESIVYLPVNPDQIKMVSSRISNIYDPYDSTNGHLTFEFAIPLSFLTEQKNHGFALGAYADLPDGKHAGFIGSWPQSLYENVKNDFSKYSVPNSFGNLELEGISSTTPPPDDFSNKISSITQSGSMWDLVPVLGPIFAAIGGAIGIIKHFTGKKKVN